VSMPADRPVHVVPAAPVTSRRPAAGPGRRPR
jgi:hypothetical protein